MDLIPCLMMEKVCLCLILFPGEIVQELFILVERLLWYQTYLLCKCQLSCKASLGHFIRCSYSATMVSMRRERAEKQGLVLLVKINGSGNFFYFLIFTIFSVMQSISTPLCCHTGVETYSSSVLFSLFSPLMLNLTSEERKKGVLKRISI